MTSPPLPLSGITVVSIEQAIADRGWKEGWIEPQVPEKKTGKAVAVVGSGPALEGWKRHAAELGVGSRVEFLGFRRDVPDIMRAADAHVLPSRYEGYSLVTQEALCCGIPAFVTRTAGIAERYPSELQDLLIPDPEDAPDLARRLRRWREGRDACAAEVAAFSERLRSYTWADMAGRFVGVVEQDG